MFSGIRVAKAKKEGSVVKVSSSHVGRFGVWLFLLASLTASSCSRPEGISDNQGPSQSEDPETPFQAQEGGAPAELDPIVASAQKLTHSAHVVRSGSPHDFQNVPAGTLVTVRLKSAAYAGMSPSDALFEAVVVEPVVVDGYTLVPVGASAAGRVESARTSNLKPNRGYVRLALQTLQLGDRRIPVQTDSLFAREAPMGASPISAIHLEKGRRLTFRLTDSANSSDPSSFATR
jgi:hypothetical protein